MIFIDAGAGIKGVVLCDSRWLSDNWDLVPQDPPSSPIPAKINRQAPHLSPNHHPLLPPPCHVRAQRNRGGSQKITRSPRRAHVQVHHLPRRIASELISILSFPAMPPTMSTTGCPRDCALCLRYRAISFSAFFFATLPIGVYLSLHQFLPGDSCAG